MIELEFDDSQVKQLLNAVVRNMTNPKPALDGIGQLVRTGILENFEVGGSYSSPDNIMGGNKKWRPLAEVTIKQRERKGKRGPHQILIDSARLVDSIVPKTGKDSVIVGTNVEYAAIHQFGSQKEWKSASNDAFTAIVNGIASRRFKSKALKRKRKLLRGYIPARPFMTIHPTKLEDMVEILSKFILAEK